MNDPVPTSPDPTTDLVAGHTPHPAEALDRYRAVGATQDEPLWSAFERSVARTPDAIAISDDTRSWTYRALRGAVHARAAGFLSAGLAPGDRVVLQYRNSGAFAITALGLVRAGLVPVMSLPAHRITEIAHLAATSGAACYVGDDIEVAAALAVR